MANLDDPPRLNGLDQKQSTNQKMIDQS